MEFARPPRPRRSAVPSVIQNSSFDPVGAVARIWAGLEADTPNGIPTSSGGSRRRVPSRSSSRPRSQEPENTCPKSEAEDTSSLREELRTEVAELMRTRAVAGKLKEELEHVRSEIDSVPAQLQAAEEQRAQQGSYFHEELAHRLAQQNAELQEHFRECMAAEVAEEIAKARKVWNAAASADAAKEREQQEEFQRLLEEKFIADSTEEVAQLKTILTQELAQQEEDIEKSSRERLQRELDEEMRQVRDIQSDCKEEMSRNEAQCRKESEVALEQQLQQQAQSHQNDVLRFEDVAEKQMHAQFKLELGSIEEKLESQAMERLECEADAVQACREAEGLVQQLEDQEDQARQCFRNELVNHQAQYASASSRCDQLEELLANQTSLAEEKMNKKLDDHLARERRLLEEQFESRSEAHLEDCWEAAKKREREAEANMRAEMSLELASEKESQVARLQQLMEKKLTEGLARQNTKSEDSGSAERDEGVVDASAQREVEVSLLRQELAEARKMKRTGGGGFDDFQSEELQKLLKMAHGENTELRETIRDLRGEINTQAGEIALLEEKVLDTLSGLRDGGREHKRTLLSAIDGQPRASSMPSKIREPSNTPPSRAQPGDIRRLPPQPKQRLASNVV